MPGKRIKFTSPFHPVPLYFMVSYSRILFFKAPQTCLFVYFPQQVLLYMIFHFIVSIATALYNLPIHYSCKGGVFLYNLLIYIILRLKVVHKWGLLWVIATASHSHWPWCISYTAPSSHINMVTFSLPKPKMVAVIIPKLKVLSTI